MTKRPEPAAVFAPNAIVPSSTMPICWRRFVTLMPSRRELATTSMLA